MEEAFGPLLFCVVLVASVVAVLSLKGRDELYKQIGKDGLDVRDSSAPRPAYLEAGSDAERDAEIRQMLEARNLRRASRGQEPLDVEVELARLTAPQADPALEAEVRQLVEARNARRARRGQPPLDVDAEVRRQLEALGEG